MNRAASAIAGNAALANGSAGRDAAGESTMTAANYNTLQSSGTTNTAVIVDCKLKGLKLEINNSKDIWFIETREILVSSQIMVSHIDARVLGMFVPIE